MDRLEKDAILLTLIEQLKAQESWCGETHIQKATYLLQDLLKVDTGFDFILYKHGPYSFDLTDELKTMRADSFLSLESSPPYGPVFKKGEMGDTLLGDYSSIIAKFDKEINFVSNKLGKMRVKELEKLTTAIFIKKEGGKDDQDSLASRINNEKPHISVQEAREAVKDAENLLREATATVNSNPF